MFDEIKGFYFHDQFANMYGCHFPNQLMFNFAIFMGNHVALGDYAAPGDIRMVCLKVRGNTVGSFTDDLQMAFHGTP